MTLAIFDLDNTLLGGDSDQLWGDFFAEHANLDKVERVARGHKYYQDYVAGILDVDEFLKFTLEPLSMFPMDILKKWRDEFIESHIKEIVLPKAIDLVAEHRCNGDTLMIITATNSFLTQPISDLFHIPILLATQPEIKDGKFTGNYTGVPTMGIGKVTALHNWLTNSEETLEGSYFYSDSANDIPLLEEVAHPVAVDADKRLTKHAEEKGWKRISLR
ncbi:MAG: HAD family hydrolase [Gammaproteobacteria bacterium]|nr:MAG: HAD family hydrolase [Gammaproteobacteria bacterium]